MLPIASGVIVAQEPKMSSMLAMFEPITLPNASAPCPFDTATKLAASSGRDVPPARSVIPITRSLIPKLRATLIAESSVRSLSKRTCYFLEARPPARLAPCCPI